MGNEQQALAVSPQDSKSGTKTQPESDALAAHDQEPTGADLVAAGLPPSQVVASGIQMADALMDVVTKAKLLKRIGQNDYMFLEGWQTVGAFIGASAVTEWSKPVTVNGTVVGYRARVSIYRRGQRVTSAEAQCTRDEKSWKTRDMFQIESMAQTRAAGKAYRLAYAWIVSLAGISPTPVEEMNGITDDGRQTRQQTQTQAQPQQPTKPPVPPKPTDQNEGMPCPLCGDGVMTMKFVNGKHRLLCSEFFKKNADNQPLCKNVIEVGAPPIINFDSPTGDDEHVDVASLPI